MFKKVLLFVLIFCFSLFNFVSAESSTETSSDVDSISLSGEGEKITWITNGDSVKGFKVVWSKNENPTYPTRSGDKYHYYSDSDKESDTLIAFDGDGTYYVRVCEYLGGKCGVYSNEIKVVIGEESATDITACTMEYAPVCGLVEVQCITTPCDPVKKTYSNKCALNSESAEYLYSGECADDDVDSIVVKGDDADIEWDVDGKSSKGFKVVWSKNENPTYPTRSGDKYHYYSDSDKESDTLTAFDGDGTYYVRVCEYLGGKCGIYSNEIKVNLESVNKDIACAMNYEPVCASNGKTYSNKCVAMNQHGLKVSYYGECKDIKESEKYYSKVMFKCANSKEYILGEESSCKDINTWTTYAKEECINNGSEFSYFSTYSDCVKDDEVISIKNIAKNLNNENFDLILGELSELRDVIKEQATKINFMEKLLDGVSAVAEKMESALNNFLSYGVDENTKKLGEGERAAVLHSFKNAFNKLPETEEELADAIKIANGRWPDLTSEEAEEKAREFFEKIYKKIADMNDSNDSAAIKVMAYGLRQKAENRNLESEKKGIEIFKNIFGYIPDSTEDWNAMQAITYSGASRGVDTDGDLLLDSREDELGTDKNNPDTDGDGFSDGVEVANGHDPLNK